MKKIIKNSLFSFILLFSVFVQASIIESSQNMSNGVGPGAATYKNTGFNYNNQLNTPLKFNSPLIDNRPISSIEFDLGDDIWIANQYSLNAVEESDLATVSCGTNCTEVLDWRYVFTLLDKDNKVTNTTIEGYYDNTREGNIVFDWETIHKAQLDPFSSAINFASGGEFDADGNTSFMAGTWIGQTFIEDIASAEVTFTILDTSLLSGTSTLAAPQKLFLSVQPLDNTLTSPALAGSVPEPGPLLLLGFGFILLGRRIFK